MSVERISTETRSTILERAPQIQPRMSDSDDIGDYSHYCWTGKYASIAHRYFNGMVEDTQLARESVGYGVLLGYRVYATTLAQVPRALLDYDSHYIKDNLWLYQTLSRSLIPALGQVLGVDSAKNIDQENALQLRNLPVSPKSDIGFRFERARYGQLVFAAKSELLPHKRGEIDENEIATSGLSYEALRLQEGCAMPLEFHQSIWDAMVRTCVFNYSLINADVDSLKAEQVTTEVQ